MLHIAQCYTIFVCLRSSGAHHVSVYILFTNDSADVCATSVAQGGHVLMPACTLPAAHQPVEAQYGRVRRRLHSAVALFSVAHTATFVGK